MFTGALSFLHHRKRRRGGRANSNFFRLLDRFDSCQPFFLPSPDSSFYSPFARWVEVDICVCVGVEPGYFVFETASNNRPVYSLFVFDHNLTIGRNLSRPPTTPSCEFYRERKILHRARDTSSCAQFINRGRRRERERMKIVRVVYYIIRFFYFYFFVNITFCIKFLW